MSKIGNEIIQGFEEAIAYAKGQKAPGVQIHQVQIGDVDPRVIRKRLRLTQEQMAGFLGTSTSGYRKWEQGNRAPSGAAKTLLRIMEREPDAVLRALVD
ncbi:MAG: type II toxin-antitoxin system MqsA family antitoxin [Devosia sp.]